MSRAGHGPRRASPDAGQAPAREEGVYQSPREVGKRRSGGSRRPPTAGTRASSSGRALSLTVRMRGPVRGHGDGVLPVRGERAVARLDGPAVGLHAHLVAAEREHRLDGQAQARPRCAGRGCRCGSWGPAAPRASRCRCRGRRTRGRRRSRAPARHPRWPRRCRPGSCPARPRRCPRASPVGSPRPAARRRPGRSPTIQVRAASPCQPSTMAPASTDTIWPSAMRRLPGMPWTTSSSIEMHGECRYGARWPGTPTNDGMAPAARMISSASASSSQRGHARPDRLADLVEDVGDEPAGDGHALDLGALLSVTRRSRKPIVRRASRRAPRPGRARR